ncbi:flavin reductase [Mangrovicoccus algicola]|uniref:Flavin reductase n=1 Tax=Mangrovicoccus algicola TaxID=2771008 RepID=A0A8J7CLV3_9RHOB|nr:flavin reductase [Mangrovicoccus algicola]MBE3639931.1 flavin reductase [Mangrovicoccus algicola]
MDDSAQFREAMSRLGAAVTVLTTDGPAGRHGMTASAVCSVTDAPPTLLVCVNRANRSHAAFTRNRTLCVNVLGEHHRALSGRFASAGATDRFEGETWAARKTGAPVLSGAVTAFDCRIGRIEAVGTHSVFFCDVEEVILSCGETTGLIWFGRGFHDLRAPA